ncbi:MAG: FtsK/SpoIIIE domain-containing protein, partial [Lachnospiraceae bacterium]|nr:FtsK/SpoIIIE domain-containing protein [Lachnospiraceae bacterium]
MQSTASTTYENLYKDQLAKAIEQYKKSYVQPLPLYKVLDPVPADIVELLKLEKKLNKNLSVVRGCAPPPISFDAKSSIFGHYDALDKSAEEKRSALIANAEAEKERRTAEHNAEIERVKQHNSSLSVPYKQKHESLLQYKDSLKHVFEHYDITPMDVNISDTVTVREFETLIDESVRVCEKYAVTKQSSIVDRILKPLKGEKNLQFTLAYSLLLLVVAYIALPLLSIPIFVMMCKSIHNLYKDIEGLRVAYALMSQVDYDRFVDESDVQQVSELSLSDIDEKLQEDLSHIPDTASERTCAEKQLININANVQRQLQEVQAAAKSEHAAILSELENKLKAVQSGISKFMSEYKPFPTVQNNSVVMDHNFALGRIEDKIDVREEVPLRNMIFDDTNRDNAINTIKLYLANMLLSVRVKQLTVEIYDPKNMCSEFTEFLKPETKEYIKPNQMELRELIKHYRELLQVKIIELDKQDIDTYNKIAEEKEIVPKEYQLLIIISGFKDLKEGNESENFMEMMRFSAQNGVIVWLLDSLTYADTLRVDDNMSLKDNAIKYTRELGQEAVNTYITALSKYKDTGIDYVSKLGNVFIPENKWWTWDTIKGVYMPWGLENGDPTRGITSWPMLSDANVHALLGGATGAGKSAEINQHLMSMITMYPPSELMLVYIDFKNVEAAKFTRGYDKDDERWMTPEGEKELREKGIYYTRLSRIPHLKIISGTTDGEYALSVFEFLMNEMSRRQQIINKFGVTKIQEMREQILAE